MFFFLISFIGFIIQIFLERHLTKNQETRKKFLNDNFKQVIIEEKIIINKFLLDYFNSLLKNHQENYRRILVKFDNLISKSKKNYIFYLNFENNLKNIAK